MGRSHRLTFSQSGHRDGRLRPQGGGCHSFARERALFVGAGGLFPGEFLSALCDWLERGGLFEWSFCLLERRAAWLRCRTLRGSGNATEGKGTCGEREEGAEMKVHGLPDGVVEWGGGTVWRAASCTLARAFICSTSGPGSGSRTPTTEATSCGETSP